MKYLKKAKSERKESMSISQSVEKIILKVKEKGDEALSEYNRMFDQSDRQRLQVERKEIEAAYLEVSEKDIRDIKAASVNIHAFSEAQKSCITPLEDFKPDDGMHLGHRVIPVSSCCCYVPGGSFPLYSTALMLIIPAKIAGVKRVAACSPCMKGCDKISPKTLVAMDIAGADEIYAVGGAHGIAAFAYGTKQISPVDLIVGPGNQYVTEAKRQCYGRVGIDFVAGPSEVLIIADDSADVRIIAADILAQSEHDELAKGMLITTDEKVAAGAIDEVENQLKNLPAGNKAEHSWRDFGEIILVSDIEEAIKYANEYAPEHLELMIRNVWDVAPHLVNYGSLFIGEYSAEVFGDYVAGTNHTLPTKKASRYTGGLWVGTFLKVCTHQFMNRASVGKLAPLTSRLAKGEGLIAHARAAEIREKLL